ncbi:hypothetical protein FQN54_005155 [Arachnomyces sp. PD_36]|nr:hypothetical protein FQN54_005155 [Arachnomyces sp. PD_36]
MPKKHHKPVFAKPTNSAHPSLASSRSSHGNPASGEGSSVNDLITRLRRTGGSPASPEEGRASPVTLTPRTVHPSIRNLLEIPETPPPRPRPTTRRIGGARVRRPPGPAAPTSGFTSNLDTPSTRRKGTKYVVDTGKTRRLERLPGTYFPGRDTLQHAVLKSMAVHWEWHVEYDGEFLSELPTRLKTLLLSYISTYSDGDLSDVGMQGFRHLFVINAEHEPDSRRDRDSNRLDLGNAIGHWINLKQLRAGLTPVEQIETSKGKEEDTTLPASWEDAAEGSELPSATLIKTPSALLPFHDLRYLSLAHPNPTSASWISLLNLLSHISTLTHLSLAHWPVPTLTPNSINARIKHPDHSSLSFSYGGTDTYSVHENNWAEASGVLKRLSRATYCLKWLDLEGCGTWYGALTWAGENDSDGLDDEASQRTSIGPDWNGTWRGIEWVGLGPGWVPRALETSGNSQTGDYSEDERRRGSRGPLSGSLASSIHAPPDIRNLAISSDEESAEQNWDVEVEREKYRRSKELEAYNEVLRKAHEVESWVQGLRRSKGGKWIKFSIDQRPGESGRDTVDFSI